MGKIKNMSNTYFNPSNQTYSVTLTTYQFQNIFLDQRTELFSQLFFMDSVLEKNITFYSILDKTNSQGIHRYTCEFSNYCLTSKYFMP